MIWTIVLGLVAGIIAKLLMPGPNDPKGLVTTALVGVIGAFLASYVGQAIGWYGAGEGAGLIASVVGAIVVLAIYSRIAKPGV
jgi:uncharacterized membrane protein YeaQ/YmgE (transglycosylase-associated protein family)